MTYAWYKRNTQDALDGMIVLTLEERGAYNTLLDLMYQRGGNLPDDARWLAGWMGCSLRKWASLRASLIAKGKIFEVDLNGIPGLFNKRVARETGKSRGDFTEVSELETARNSDETATKSERNEAEIVVASNENNGLQALDIEKNRLDKKEREDARKRAPRGSRLVPDGWHVSQAHYGAGLELGFSVPDIDREAVKFRNYERKTAVTDWNRAFHNWLVRADEYRRERNPKPKRVGFV